MLRLAWGGGRTRHGEPLLKGLPVCHAHACGLGASACHPSHAPTPPPSRHHATTITPPSRRHPRYPQLMAALMARFGGHPYDQMDLLPFNVVDPVKRTPLENMWGMGHNRNELVRRVARAPGGWPCSTTACWGTHMCTRSPGVSRQRCMRACRPHLAACCPTPTHAHTRPPPPHTHTHTAHTHPHTAA
jgi:hypothetical protein